MLTSHLKEKDKYGDMFNWEFSLTCLLPRKSDFMDLCVDKQAAQNTVVATVCSMELLISACSLKVTYFHALGDA